jgi:hypothetical protein
MAVPPRLKENEGESSLGISNQDREAVTQRVNELIVQIESVKSFAESIRSSIAQLPQHRAAHQPNDSPRQEKGNGNVRNEARGKKFKFELTSAPRYGLARKATQSCIYCETTGDATQIVQGTQCVFIDVRKIIGDWDFVGAACEEHHDDLAKIFASSERFI